MALKHLISIISCVCSFSPDMVVMDLVDLWTKSKTNYPKGDKSYEKD